jgi:hypothetical protein
MKKIVTALIIVFLAMSTIFQAESQIPEAQAKTSTDVFIGVDIAYYTTVDETKNLIDEYSQYSNLIVFGCCGLTLISASLNDVCQYAYDKGMSFIVYTDSYNLDIYNFSHYRFFSWASRAKANWGNQFLGLYAKDELGGYQIDKVDSRLINYEPANFSECAINYVQNLNFNLNLFRNRTYPELYSCYTSDYAEYWFDYKGGYDTVFAEVGWGANQQSKQLNIALCRGAATMQNHDWGAIITWNGVDSETVESGPALLNDLKLAYQNGAKYINIFDSNKAYDESTLTDDQKQALKDFWQYIQANPQRSSSVSQRVAFVLPKNYGAAFRGADDTVWGFWNSQHNSTDPSDNILLGQMGNIWSNLNVAQNKYGDKLDVIYDENLTQNSKGGYSRLVYWNGTTVENQSESLQLKDFLPALVAGAVLVTVAMPIFKFRKQIKKRIKETEK